MRINPYLNFNGQCEAAFKFYEKCLGGKIVAMMDQGSAPFADEVPPERRKAIIHARLLVGDQVLMGSDAPPEHFSPASGMYVTLNFDDVSEAERVYKALSEGGEEQMPFGPTFFAEGFGMAKDQFGTPWMVVCEKKH